MRAMAAYYGLPPFLCIVHHSQMFQEFRDFFCAELTLFRFGPENLWSFLHSIFPSSLYHYIGRTKIRKSIFEVFPVVKHPKEFLL